VFFQRDLFAEAQAQDARIRKTRKTQIRNGDTRPLRGLSSATEYLWRPVRVREGLPKLAGHVALIFQRFEQASTYGFSCSWVTQQEIAAAVIQ
jgi:hypothetical protein